MSIENAAANGLTRRDALKVGAGAAGTLALAGGLLGQGVEAAAAPAVIGDGPYGPLKAPDANGVALPDGFTSRIVARTNVPLGPSLTPFHTFPDGMGTYEADDGGFVLVSNSEFPATLGGGAAAIRFDKDFKVTDYYRILSDTNINCAGGVTPWDTWLSCEETPTGRVWECDPFGEKDAIPRPAMGVFKHEAAAVDPIGKQVYLTEDEGDGNFYRFTPDSYPDLTRGKLEVAAVAGDGQVGWLPVPDPQFLAGLPTRQQVPAAEKFKRGEGCWYDEGIIYFATTQDDRVWAYNCAEKELEVLYDGVALGPDAPLHDTDNVTVSPISGDLFVAEDADDLQVCLISTEGEAAPFAQLPGEAHAQSEICGPVFDPSGSRFYFASQKGGGVAGVVDGGAIFEITGPFRRTREEPPPPPDPDEDKPKIKIRTLGKPTLRGLIKTRTGLQGERQGREPPGDARSQADHQDEAQVRQGFARRHDRHPEDEGRQGGRQEDPREGQEGPEGPPPPAGRRPGPARGEGDRRRRQHQQDGQAGPVQLIERRSGGFLAVAAIAAALALAGCGESTDSSDSGESPRANQGSGGSAVADLKARAKRNVAATRARARKARQKAIRQARRQKARAKKRTARVTGDLDCGAFSNQAQAQKRLAGGDPYGLDGDGDNLACTSLPCPCSKAKPGGKVVAAGLPAAAKFRAEVDSVADGDTLNLITSSGREVTVRMIGIDTPEVYGGVECGGRAASNAMKALAVGVVTVRTDPTQDRLDRYGRLLAYINKGALDLGRVMVARGLASVYVYDEEFLRYPSYDRAEDAAIAADRGSLPDCDLAPG